MICGIIPARGGSQGVPKKNIKEICGKPLIAWTIEAAQKSKLLDDFYVSTDCEEIAAVSSEYGAKVLMRPKELAANDSNIIDALKYVIGQVPMDTLVLLQPTSPQRGSDLIDECIEKFVQTHADNLASGYISHLYEYGTTPPNRQENKGFFRNDGAVFVVRANLISESVDQHLKTGIRLGDYTEFVFSPQEMHYEIDTPFDFWLVGKILERVLEERA